MKKRNFALLLVSVLLISLSMTSCTQNQRAKHWGGEAKVYLPAGKQLDMVTWKEDNLWILTSERPNGVAPKKYQFNEESSWGLLEGTYVIVEK